MDAVGRDREVGVEPRWLEGFLCRAEHWVSEGGTDDCSQLCGVGVGEEGVGCLSCRVFL
jgi:hypothetical protein